MIAVALWLAAAPCLAASKPNVILISIDDMRKDRLSEELAPNLTRLASQGISFERTYSAATWTLPSHATMLTGRLPHHHEAIDSNTGGLRPIRAGETTLATWFKKAGYRTAGFYNAPYLSPQLGFSRGFDDYRMTNMFDVFSDAARWASSGKEPFFLFVHTYRVHAYPGVIDPAARVDAAYCAAGAARYDDAVRAVDRQIGDFLESLEGAGALQNAVIAVTSDHGEELCDQGRGFGHQKRPYEEQIHVPFILRAPGQKPRKESALVSGADVAPTLAAAAGAPLPQPLDGVSRLDAACESNAAVVIEASDWVAMKDADATLVLALNGTESSLGAAKPPAAWKPQLQKYMDILRNLHAPATNTPAADAELRGKLKAAGYLK